MLPSRIRRYNLYPTLFNLLPSILRTGKVLSEDIAKKSALLLKEGAIMLPETCPICGSPLFKLKDGRIVCPIHGEIRKLKKKMEGKEEKLEEVIEDVIDALKDKLKLIIPKIEAGRKAEAEEIYTWLKALETAINVKKNLKT